jgi:hypothetical protein
MTGIGGQKARGAHALRGSGRETGLVGERSDIRHLIPDICSLTLWIGDAAGLGWPVGRDCGWKSAPGLGGRGLSGAERSAFWSGPAGRRSAEWSRGLAVIRGEDEALESGDGWAEESSVL